MPDAYHSRRQTARHAEDSRRHRDERSSSPDHKRGRRPDDAEGRRSHKREQVADHGDSSRRHRSPHRRHGKHRHHREHDAPAAAPPAELPLGARQLTKGDLQRFEPLLAHYLDLQKQRYIEDMDDREVRGRWKSFVGKWNRGELAEGWYDPEIFERIVASQPEAETGPAGHVATERLDERHSPDRRSRQAGGSGEEDAGSDSDYGPALPFSTTRDRRIGVGIPSRDDLALRDETRAEERDAAREDLRAARRADRKLQKEQLEELVPRAEPGTRERRLEKKREASDKMRQFRDGSPGGGDAAHDGELMGGDDSLAELKQRKAQERRRKSEREVRREELQRARQKEIEEKKQRWEEREKKTMGMLQELAKQRFG